MGLSIKLANSLKPPSGIRAQSRIAAFVCKCPFCCCCCLFVLLIYLCITTVSELCWGGIGGGLEYWLESRAGHCVFAEMRWLNAAWCLHEKKRKGKCCLGCVTSPESSRVQFRAASLCFYRVRPHVLPPRCASTLTCACVDVPCRQNKNLMPFHVCVVQLERVFFAPCLGTNSTASTGAHWKELIEWCGTDSRPRCTLHGQHGFWGMDFFYFIFFILSR